MISPIENSQSARDYLARVGATMRSLFTAVITTKSMGYEKDVHVIRFDRMGNVRAPEALQPSEEEARAIAEEFAQITFPTQTSLTSLPTSSLPPLIQNAQDKDLFIFRNRRKEIIFVQVRLDLPNGDKKYVPQTYWSDGEWRALEPEDGLPIYGIEEVYTGARVFLHEGAKAARAAKHIASDPKHPFHEYFATGIHVGWIGGTQHVNRTRWQDLASLPSELVIVPDNDFTGRTKVPRIVHHFECICRVTFFGSDWPSSWDVADTIPPQFLTDDGQYIGPSFESMLESVSWATEEVGTTENGRPIFGIRELFASKWVRIQSLKQYSHMDQPEQIFDRDQFNIQVRPYSDVLDTAQLLAKVAGNVAAGITFMPNKPSGLISLGGQRLLNQYRDRRIRPVKGDVKPFWDFLRYLVPDEDERKVILSWIATLYAKPEVRMGFGILAITKQQGIGKSTLGDILGRLIGKAHVSYPGDAMLQSDFNGWIVNKRLIVVNEIYAGQNWKVYNRLKTLITDPDVDANVKHLATYTLANWAHFFACSNSMEALRVEHDDRRWFVPELPEDKLSTYEPIYRWVERGGVNALAYELLHHPEYVRPQDTAPLSKTKLALIDQSMPADERMVVTLCRRIPVGYAVSAEEIWFWLQKEMRGRTYITPQRIMNLIREKGFYVGEPIEIAGDVVQLIWRNEQSKLVAVNGYGGPEFSAKVLSLMKRPEEVFSRSGEMAPM